jgi:hypothetical protein
VTDRYLQPIGPAEFASLIDVCRFDASEVLDASVFKHVEQPERDRELAELLDAFLELRCGEPVPALVPEQRLRGVSDVSGIRLRRRGECLGESAADLDPMTVAIVRPATRVELGIVG